MLNISYNYEIIALIHKGPEAPTPLWSGLFRTPYLSLGG